jgi:serine/threonine protein kinase
VSERRCSRCGAATSERILAGLCPNCLLREGLGGGEDDPDLTLVAEASVGGTGRDASSPIPPFAGSFEARYTLVGEHARGGMGRVLVVRDHQIDRDVAMKELLPGTGDAATPALAARSKDLVARLVREARITGQLEHPAITPVHELGWREDGTPFYTMKLVRGRTLAEAIGAAGTLPQRLALLPHFVDLCQAVAYAHDRGVVHRDIKPQNVMVGDYGETVVLDWGLARVRTQEDPRAVEVAETLAMLRDGREADAGATAYGQALGTPAYMPPEQALGRLDEVDERSDVYALGAVLYQILTGEPPFTGGSVAELLRRAIVEAPVPVRKRERNAPSDLVRICERAMAKERASRYGSAQDLARAVAGWVPRPFHWSAERPYLWEIVPELAALPGRERGAVVNAAHRRALRDWRFPVLGLAGLLLAFFFAACAVMVPVVLHSGIEAMERLEAEQRYAEILRQSLAAAAAQGAAVRVPQPVAIEPPGFVALMRWPARYPRLVGVVTVAGILQMSYVSARFYNEWRRQWLLPHVRDVLAERSVKRAA